LAPEYMPPPDVVWLGLLRPSGAPSPPVQESGRDADHDDDDRYGVQPARAREHR
jgi:hypothetical protein